MTRKREVKEGVIIFTRYPEPGKVKTRLIPDLAEGNAALLQRCMTEDTLERVRSVMKDRPLSVEVCYQGGSLKLMERWLGKDLSYTTQGNGDLGERIARSFINVFQSGLKNVILIGTDCPDMTDDIIRTALDSLQHKDCVLGPAKDGGYYLIGFANDSFEKKVFEAISWGTHTVLEETVQVLKGVDLTIHFLHELNDLDTIDDVKDFLRRKETEEFVPKRTISFLLKLVGNMN